MHIPPNLGGVYKLGKDRHKVSAVGLTDHDLRETIKSFEGRYAFFWFEVALTPHEGFESQCWAYHEHLGHGLDDVRHPLPPGKLQAKCPVCGRERPSAP